MGPKPDRYHRTVCSVLGESDGMIRLKLQAPAVEGKANAALVVFLAERSGCPKPP
jgi:uncharacterized protein